MKRLDPGSSVLLPPAAKSLRLAPPSVREAFRAKIRTMAGHRRDRRASFGRVFCAHVLPIFTFNSEGLTFLSSRRENCGDPFPSPREAFRAKIKTVAGHRHRKGNELFGAYLYFCVCASQLSISAPKVNAHSISD